MSGVKLINSFIVRTLKRCIEIIWKEKYISDKYLNYIKYFASLFKKMINYLKIISFVFFRGFLITSK